MCSIVWVRDLVMSYLAKCVFCFPTGVLPEWLPNHLPTRSWESSLSWCNSPLKFVLIFSKNLARIWEVGYSLHALLFLCIAGHAGGFSPCDLASHVIPKCQLFVHLSHKIIAMLKCAQRRSSNPANSWLHSEKHVNAAGRASISDSTFTRPFLWLAEANCEPREIHYPQHFP